MSVKVQGSVNQWIDLSRILHVTMTFVSGETGWIALE